MMELSFTSRAPAAALAALTFALLPTAACTDRSLCERAAECANDPPGEDFVNICVERRSGRQRALRANQEEECLALADASERLDACRAQIEDCDDFNDGDLGGECDDELDDYRDAIEDAADNRFGGTPIGRGGFGANVFDAVPHDCSSFD